MRDLNLDEIVVASGGDIPPPYTGGDLDQYLLQVTTGAEFKPPWWLVPPIDSYGNSMYYDGAYQNEYMNAYSTWVMDNFFGPGSGC